MRLNDNATRRKRRICCLSPWTCIIQVRGLVIHRFPSQICSLRLWRKGIYQNLERHFWHFVSSVDPRWLLACLWCAFLAPLIDRASMPVPTLSRFYPETSSDRLAILVDFRFTILIASVNFCKFNLRASTDHAIFFFILRCRLNFWR